MEIEAKFLATAETLAAVQLLTALGPFTLEAVPTPEQQRNIYYDTADSRLQTARFGLRVRHIDGQQIATLKGEATVQDGVYSRGEWEQPVTSDDPQQWPAGELRERVLALIGGAALLPSVSIETSRKHSYARRTGAQPFAEISLDEGVMLASTHRQAFREIEIELLPDGDRTDFDRLLALLRQTFSLTPEPRSKLERALALRQAADDDAPATD